MKLWSVIRPNKTAIVLMGANRQHVIGDTCYQFSFDEHGMDANHCAIGRPCMYIDGEYRETQTHKINVPWDREVTLVSPIEKD